MSTMTWTYTGDLKGSDLDWVRFTIGDTEADTPLLYDEEILAVLSIHNRRTDAAICCMENILLKLARKCSYRIGPESVSASDRYKHYKDFYESYKDSLSLGLLTPQQPQSGTPIFNIGMMDGGRV